MTRQTQTILYHLLPVVFWLLAIGGSISAVFLIPSLQGGGGSSLFGYFLPALLVLLCVVIISRIRRRSSSVEQCFWVAILLGVASYWLPSVLFMVLPIWIYLIYKNQFGMQSFVASLLGIAFVAVWMAVLCQFSILNYQFSILKGLLAWIPVGAFIIAWFASTIARQNLRVR